MRRRVLGDECCTLYAAAQLPKAPPSHPQSAQGRGTHLRCNGRLQLPCLAGARPQCHLALLLARACRGAGNTQHSLRGPDIKARETPNTTQPGCPHPPSGSSGSGWPMSASCCATSCCSRASSPATAARCRSSPSCAAAIWRRQQGCRQAARWGGEGAGQHQAALPPVLKLSSSHLPHAPARYAAETGHTSSPPAPPHQRWRPGCPHWRPSAGAAARCWPPPPPQSAAAARPRRRGAAHPAALGRWQQRA